jgi:NAD(P)H-dependent FMN reductase
MKAIYLTIGMICALLSSNSYSQKLEETVKTELPCYNTQELFKSLREKFQELPLLTGKTDDEANSIMSVWLNPIENDWTIVATKKDLSCVVGTGTDMKIIPTRKGTAI